MPVSGIWHAVSGNRYLASRIENLDMGAQFRIAQGIEHFKFEPEGFIVLEFTGHEAISQLTHFDIRLLSDDQEVDFSTMLNQRASLKIWDWESQDYVRVYHGIICSFEQLGHHEIGSEGRYAVYRAEMVPLLWRLTLNYQSRIFQDKSVPDIIEEVLQGNEFGGDDYRLSLDGSYDPTTDPPREFCVQYGESDFNFLSRLMEEEGIFYFFEYGDDKETMVIADSSSALTETSPMSEIPYEEASGLQSLEAEYIHSLRYREHVLPIEFMVKDFNFKTPSTNLKASSKIEQDGSFRVYNFPGRFGVLNRGTDLARIRNEENEAGRKIISGEGNCRSLCAGYLFTLSGHPRSDLEAQFLLTKVTHHGVQGGIWATDSKMSYGNMFECIPADIPYRPLRVTPKPRIQGTQTAIVVGPSGQEIYPDEYGRVKIQFHWDLEGQMDENSSCWIRVSQPWAGKGWGGMVIPRIGQEVIVDFIEGDPDQPIIIGNVYNGDNPVPYNLPGNKVKTTIMSNSSPGGGGLNELRFDDTKGKEEVYLHAQYDLNEVIEHDMSTKVKNDQSITIDNNRSINVGGTHTETIKKDTKITISEGNYEHTVSAGTAKISVKGDVTEKYDAKQKTTVKSDIDVKSESSHFHLEASTEIHLKVGASELLMKSDGSIKLKGVDVAIDGATVTIHGGTVTSKADTVHSTEGANVMSTGSATNVVKGGMVMLNP